MRISVKLTVGVLLIGALLAAVGSLANMTNSTVQTSVEHLSQNSLVDFVAAEEMALAVHRGHDALHDLIAQKRQRPPAEQLAKQTGEVDPRQSLQRSLDSFQLSLDNARASCRGSLDAAERAGDEALTKALTEKLDRYMQVQEAFSAHRAMIRQCLKLIGSDVAGADNYLETKLDTHFTGVLAPLLDYQKQSAEREFTSDVNGVKRSLATASARNTLATLAALLLALALGLYLSRSIGRPLERLKAAATKIGQGRLETRVARTSRDELGVLAEAFNRMAADLQATTVSKSYVDNILESMSEMLIVVDGGGRIQMVNRAGCEQLGYASDELVGKPLQHLVVGEDGQMPALAAMLAGEREYRLCTSGGEKVTVHWSAAPLHDGAGQPQGAVCAALNIEQRKLDQQRLLDSLSEKEVLLKEVHHRVKNNLQIISSLLALQAGGVSDGDTRRLFEESQSRIRSMALIHEQLYQSDELAGIDFSEYARRLCGHLIESTGGGAGKIKLHVDIDPAPLPLNLAIPCGMILNELVSNAIKHAFAPGVGGAIQVAFQAGESHYALRVGDDGVGIEPALATAKPKSIGLKVVQALTRQLHGRLDIAGDDGAQFTVTFPNPNTEEKIARESFPNNQSGSQYADSVNLETTRVPFFPAPAVPAALQD